MHIKIIRYLLPIALCWIITLTTIEAQVVIGSSAPLKKGALLDLKQMPDEADGQANSTKGLLLPRVNLEALNNLRPKDASFTGDEVHIGLTVFNMHEDDKIGLCKGIYIWSGLTWTFLHSRDCSCEYTIVGHDGVEYHIYCEDFQGSQADAGNVCRTKAEHTERTYHLMSAEEFVQIWDRPTKDKGEYKFTDGSYHLNYKNWTTLGIIESNNKKMVGVGNHLPGGAAIGGKILGNNIVRCIRD